MIWTFVYALNVLCDCTASVLCDILCKYCTAPSSPPKPTELHFQKPTSVALCPDCLQLCDACHEIFTIPWVMFRVQARLCLTSLFPDQTWLRGVPVHFDPLLGLPTKACLSLCGAVSICTALLFSLSHCYHRVSLSTLNHHWHVPLVK